MMGMKKQYPKSLPSRERGLKYYKRFVVVLTYHVAPFAGAWIEIIQIYAGLDGSAVAPFAGAWIEILFWSKYRILIGSRSLRGSVD